MVILHSPFTQMDRTRDKLIEQVMLRVNAYARHPAERLHGHLFLVAKDTKRNRGYFVTAGNFGRAEFKVAVHEAQAAGLDASVLYVYGRTATYSGGGIHFVKLDEIGVMP